MKLNTKLRHVDVHQHGLRQKVQAGRISVSGVSTTEMPADGLTKVLFKQKHEEFLKQLNLMDISDRLNELCSLIMANQPGGVCGTNDYSGHVTAY